MIGFNAQIRTDDRDAPRYIARIPNVHEVSLLGGADLAFWKARLQTQNLLPAAHGGKAQIWIIASALRFMGVAFTEVSVAILLAEQNDFAGLPAAFLAQAFSSFRPFAWCERALFHIPSQHADCRVSVSNPVSFGIACGTEIVLRAMMNANALHTACEPSRTADDFWAGPVFLPASRPTSDGDTHLFFSRIEGHAQVHPFVSGEDVFFLAPTAESGIFRALIESQFAPEQWIVRADATHSKSRTRLRISIR